MYRVQVVHSDPDHPNAEPAHVGPAFDESYREMAKHFRLEGDEIDLLTDARAFRDRARADALEGYSYEVVELTSISGNEVAWTVVEDDA